MVYIDDSDYPEGKEEEVDPRWARHEDYIKDTDARFMSVAKDITNLQAQMDHLEPPEEIPSERKIILDASGTPEETLFRALKELHLRIQV